LQKELDDLPGLIDRLESTVAELQKTMGAADFYQDRERADDVIARAAEAQRELDAGYARWDELETMKSGG